MDLPRRGLATAAPSVRAAASAVEENAVEACRAGRRCGAFVARAIAVTGVTNAFAMSDAAARGQETTRVSVSSSGQEADAASYEPALAANGGFVVFSSLATDLAPGHPANRMDVYVRDLATGTTTLESVSSSGQHGGDSSFNPSISADGRFVAFESNAPNLVPHDTNRTSDIFLRDRTNATTTRVSIDSSGAQANDWSGYDRTAISADGRFVAFESNATNLVAGDTNGAVDIFVHDVTTGVTERVSVDSSGRQADGKSLRPALSADGRFVAFDSEATNLVAGDRNRATDLFVHDRLTGSTDRVSVDSAGAESDGFSFAGALSADGSVVVFASGATDLVAGDANGCVDVFVHELASGATRRVSLGLRGTEANGDSGFYYGLTGPCLSADGRFVAFESHASNLVRDDSNGASDVFVFDQRSGVTRRASVDSDGVEADSDCDFPSLSSDGGLVVFEGTATNLVAGDGNGCYDVFLRERCALDASWTNYGAGLPGSHGVPAFTARVAPELGRRLVLDLENSAGSYTVGLLFIGAQRASLPTAWGGELLLLPAVTELIGLAPTGTLFIGRIPDDDRLCGALVDLQAIEADPGAVKGVAFTAGLELTLGN
jgi:Tol biopolymer transport system component